MKCLLFVIFTTTCFGQHLFEFGVKGGVPLSPALEAGVDGGPRLSEVATSDTRAYIIGPMVGLRLPRGFGVEVDALYSHLGFDDLLTTFILGPIETVQTRTLAGSWEFPIVGKYHFRRSSVASPYVEGGVSFRHLTGVSTTVTQTFFVPPQGTVVGSMSTSSNNNFGIDRSRSGGVVGVGLEFRAAILRIAPEIRYTRWGADRNLDSAFLAVHSNQNEVSFLVGIAF